jgi:hypothetical protein
MEPQYEPRWGFLLQRYCGIAESTRHLSEVLDQILNNAILHLRRSLAIGYFWEKAWQGLIGARRKPVEDFRELACIGALSDNCRVKSKQSANLIHETKV